MNAERMNRFTFAFQDLNEKERANVIKQNYADIWVKAFEEIPEIQQASQNLLKTFQQYNLLSPHFFSLFTQKRKGRQMNILWNVDRSFDLIGRTHKSEEAVEIIQTARQIFEKIKSVDEPDSIYFLRYYFDDRRLALNYTNHSPNVSREKAKKTLMLIKKEQKFTDRAKKIELQLAFGGDWTYEFYGLLNEWKKTQEEKLRSYFEVWENLLEETALEFKKQLKQLPVERLIENWLMNQNQTRYMKDGTALNIKAKEQEKRKKE